jgi:peptidoglycan/xylan/chitin deacetylase (PgdA/CDA1 family)
MNSGVYNKKHNIMKMRMLNSILFLSAIIFILASCSMNKRERKSGTIITKWQDGKTGAVSLTFDDGSINQFRVALPLLDSLGFPATFFIITGDIPGSKYQPRFIGRSASQIIRETASIPTDEKNLFERASLANYAPYDGLRDYFSRAGELFESGKIKEACRLIDIAYSKVRKHELKTGKVKDEVTADKITWAEIKQFALHGHEFASHTITHPRLAILDSANLLYELEQSRQEMLEQLGTRFTFSAECPYGTENERVMKYAYQVYPALRNRMPEPFLEELDRGNETTPGSSVKEYVQWQRGALTETPVDLMKSWIDTCAAKKNIWLVLVFHGVEGIGWEPLSRTELKTYYGYLKSAENDLWIATFGDVARYIKERMNARLETTHDKGSILVKLSHDLGHEYDLPLTLKTYISKSGKAIMVKQGDKAINFITGRDGKARFILYRAFPNIGPVSISFNHSH